MHCQKKGSNGLHNHTTDMQHAWWCSAQTVQLMSKPEPWIILESLMSPQQDSQESWKTLIRQTLPFPPHALHKQSRCMKGLLYQSVCGVCLMLDRLCITKGFPWSTQSPKANAQGTAASWLLRAQKVGPKTHSYNTLDLQSPDVCHLLCCMKWLFLKEHDFRGWRP